MRTRWSSEAAAAGHPVIRIELADPIDLAGGVRPLGGRDRDRGRRPRHRPVRPAQRRGGEAADARPARRPRRARPPSPRRSSRDGGLTLYGDAPLRLSATATARSSASSAGSSTGASPTRTSRSRRSSPRPRPATRRSPSIRTTLRDATHCATTAGYGPRFLHSTGQLHKGGAPIGWFLQLTADHPIDRPIPGWPYTFGRLIDAQARGRLRVDRVPRPADRAGPPRRRPTCATQAASPRRSSAPDLRSSATATSRQRRTDQHEALTGGPDADRVRRARPDGANMVRRLLRDGHEVVAYNRTPEKTQEIAGEGAIAAFSIAGARRRSSRSRGRSGSWSRPATRPRPRSPS